MHIAHEFRGQKTLSEAVSERWFFYWMKMGELERIGYLWRLALPTLEKIGGAIDAIDPSENGRREDGKWLLNGPFYGTLRCS